MNFLSRIFLSHRCTNGGNQHNYDDVYDESSCLPTRFTKINATFAADLYALKDNKSVYVKSVCKWCGNEIKR